MTEDGFLIFSIVVMVATAIILGSWHQGQQMTRADAIDAGVAEWTVDPYTGKTQFKWKNPCDTQTKKD